MGGTRRRRGQQAESVLPPPPVGEPIDALPPPAGNGSSAGTGEYPGGTDWPDAQSGAPDGADAPPPRRRLGTVVRVGFLVVVAGGAIAGWLGMADRDDAGEITKGGELAATEVRVGDCLDDPGAQTEVTEIRAIPCAEPHDLEVYYEFEHADADSPPSPDAAFALIEQECFPAFETFVGTPYADSELDVYWFEPTTAGWTQGDRTVQCAVYSPDGAQLTGSARGSRR